MGRTYAAMPFEYLETLASLNDAQFGRLMRWLLKYAATGEYGTLTGKEALFCPMVQVQEDRFRESYEKSAGQRSEQARAAARARWERELLGREP